MSALDVLEGLGQPTLPRAPGPDLSSYDRILVMICGKDSLACLLHLLDLGVDKSKIELHHNSVDGGYLADGSAESTLMDWPCTHDYIRALGEAFGLPVFYSFRERGIEGEMLRENSGSAPIVYQRVDGELVRLPSDKSKPNTRLKFPQVSGSLVTRWCSSIAKISVAERMLIHDERFRGTRTLVVTGERAEESPNRARYAAFEPHRADNRDGRVPRHVDAWRPAHQWTRHQVWAIIRRYSCLAHPAYYVGLGRASCFSCVFNTPDTWATMKLIDPPRFGNLAGYEKRFGFTIHRSRTLEEQAARGTPYEAEERWIKVALSREFREPIFMDPWVLPLGAYGDNSGPT